MGTPISGQLSTNPQLETNPSVRASFDITEDTLQRILDIQTIFDTQKRAVIGFFNKNRPIGTNRQITLQEKITLAHLVVSHLFNMLRNNPDLSQEDHLAFEKHVTQQFQNPAFLPLIEKMDLSLLHYQFRKMGGIYFGDFTYPSVFGYLEKAAQTGNWYLAQYILMQEYSLGKCQRQNMWMLSIQNVETVLRCIINTEKATAIEALMFLHDLLELPEMLDVDKNVLLVVFNWMLRTIENNSVCYDSIYIAFLVKGTSHKLLPLIENEDRFPSFLVKGIKLYLQIDRKHSYDGSYYILAHSLMICYLAKFSINDLIYMLCELSCIERNFESKLTLIHTIFLLLQEKHVLVDKGSQELTLLFTIYRKVSSSSFWKENLQQENEEIERLHIKLAAIFDVLITLFDYKQKKSPVHLAFGFNIQVPSENGQYPLLYSVVQNLFPVHCNADLDLLSLFMTTLEETLKNIWLRIKPSCTKSQTIRAIYYTYKLLQLIPTQKGVNLLFSPNFFQTLLPNYLTKMHKNLIEFSKSNSLSPTAQSNIKSAIEIWENFLQNPPAFFEKHKIRDKAPQLLKELTAAKKQEKEAN